MANKLSDIDLCGTLDLNYLYDGVEAFKAGEPVDEGITIDEVEMSVQDDWKEVGTFFDVDGDVTLYSPLLVVDGEKAERMIFETDIEGFKPERGHEYRIKVRRFYITTNPLCHCYELMSILSDTVVNNTEK